MLALAYADCVHSCLQDDPLHSRVFASALWLVNAVWHHPTCWLHATLLLLSILACFAFNAHQSLQKEPDPHGWHCHDVL